MKEVIKNIYRFIKYKEHRQKLAREKKIKPVQAALFAKEFSREINKLIIFFVPGADRFTGKETMSGGVISILSIAEETKKIYNGNSQVGVIVCTHSKDNLLLKYDNIENSFNVYSFNQVIHHFVKLEEIIIHTPDFLSSYICQNLSSQELTFLHNISTVHYNIMNQNIKLMPTKDEVEKIKNIFPFVTITTAHQQYCTKYYRDYFGVSLHKLSVWISPENYNFVTKTNKENLLVYSPDIRPEKEEIINKLKEIKGLQLQQIQGLTYSQFKDLISKAKWSLTFGEGLDGYYIEPVFSGAISFAVYNEDFFTDCFKDLKTVYKSYENLQNNIVNDIQILNADNISFAQYQKQQFDICADLYSSKVYKQNIEKFYRHEFTFS